MNIKIACAVTKKKMSRERGQRLVFFFYQRDTEVHFREFYCVIFYMFEICRRGRGAYPPPPLPDLRMDWEVAEKAL